MRILVNGGRVLMNGNGKSFPHYGVSSSKGKDLSKNEELKEEVKETVGGSLDMELVRRLNSINIKKPKDELKSRLTALDPKKKLINFTI
jgi:hypothetical protein